MTAQPGVVRGITTCTRCLSADDAEATNRLRVAGYGAAREFELIGPDLLRWDAHDDAGIVLGVWDAGVLVSTLRGVVAADRRAAEDLFCCTIEVEQDVYPLLMFGRASTLPSHRKMGLNALLRLHVLRGVTDSTPLGGSMVMPYEGAPRLRLLGEIGYRFHRPTEVWDPEMRGHQWPLLGVLPRDGFAAAIKRLEPLGAPAAERYPWTGLPVEIPVAVHHPASLSSP